MFDPLAPFAWLFGVENTEPAPPKPPPQRTKHALQANPKKTRAPLASVGNRNTLASAGATVAKAATTPIEIAPTGWNAPLLNTPLPRAGKPASPALSTVGRGDATAWRTRLRALQAGEVVHAATAAAAAAAARQYGKTVSATEMKDLQEQVSLIARLSVSALEDAAAELDHLHHKETARLRERRDAVRSQPHSVAEQAGSRDDSADRVALAALVAELDGIECMCIPCDCIPHNIRLDAGQDAGSNEAAADEEGLGAPQVWYTPSATPYFTPAEPSSSMAFSEERWGDSFILSNCVSGRSTGATNRSGGDVLAQLLAAGDEAEHPTTQAEEPPATAAGHAGYTSTEMAGAVGEAEADLDEVAVANASDGRDAGIVPDASALEAWLARRKQELVVERCAAARAADEERAVAEAAAAVAGSVHPSAREGAAGLLMAEPEGVGGEGVGAASLEGEEVRTERAEAEGARAEGAEAEDAEAEGAEEGSEVRELRRALEEVRAELQRERCARQRMMRASVVCPHCETIC